MITNDEDIELFLEDLGRVLRKYHYDISPFSLRRITDPKIIIGGFRGERMMFIPEYCTMSEENRKILWDKDNK